MTCVTAAVPSAGAKRTSCPSLDEDWDKAVTTSTRGDCGSDGGCDSARCAATGACEVVREAGGGCDGGLDPGGECSCPWATTTICCIGHTRGLATCTGPMDGVAMGTCGEATAAPRWCIWPGSAPGATATGCGATATGCWAAGAAVTVRRAFRSTAEDDGRLGGAAARPFVLAGWAPPVPPVAAAIRAV